jgi:hypothetical protein
VKPARLQIEDDPHPELGIVDIRPEPHVEIATVTPEMAADMLAHNTHNRSLRNNRVTQLADTMRRGEWGLSPDAIMFDTQGVLRNGQHRISAVVEANTSAQFIILTGVPPRNQEITDIGLTRRLADILRLRGETQSASIAAALVALYRLRYAIETGTPNVPPPRYPTPQMLLTIYEQEPGIKASISSSRMASGRVTRRHGSTAALHYVFATLSDPDAGEDADDFFHKLATGLELTEDDPIYTLRRILLNTSPRPLAARMNALTIKAWNAWREGVPIRILSWKQGGSSREPFPVPK